MSWDTSDRKLRLPEDWWKRRQTVLKKAQGKCAKCGGRATDVDHIVAGDNHEYSNLQALCRPCHKVKTVQDTRKARRAIRQRLRRVEKHPGLRD